MSDGPEKTLRMPKGWREVAKCARLDAYEEAEVSRKMVEAVKQDWDAEKLSKLIVSLRRILGDGRQVSLFSKDGPKQPFSRVPFNVESAEHPLRQSVARSRGFNFALVSGIATYWPK